MSSVDGPKAGSQDIGEALVAALGFEPTPGATTKTSDERLEGQPDITWSDDEMGNAVDPNSQSLGHESQDPIVVADGKSSGSSVAPAPREVADSSMSPAKGKGKGPRKLATDAPAGDAKDSRSGKSTKQSSKKGAKAAAKKAADEASDKESYGAPDDEFDSVLDSTLDGDQALDAESDLDLFDKTVEVPNGVTSPPSGRHDEDPAVTGQMKTLTAADVVSGLDETGPMKVDAGEITELVPQAEASPPVETIVVENGIPMVETQSTISDSPPPPLLEQPLAPPIVEQQPLGSPIGAPGAAPTSPPVVNGDAGPSRAVSVPEILEHGIFKRKKRVQARKVRRVVRHIDPWSVLTFSVLFFLCLYAALLLSSVLVWNAAVAAGTIEKIESFIRELGDYETYEIDGDVVFRATMIIAGVLTLASSVLVVLLSVVFNLISDLIGGIRLTVIEEETVRVKGE